MRQAFPDRSSLDKHREQSYRQERGQTDESALRRWPRGLPVRVLVVDDDPIVLASCKRILEVNGLAVVTAASVQDAIVEIVSQEFGLIIVDLTMPERDGLQLVQKVRSERKPIPTIAMSGHPTSETIHSSLASGAYVFLPKPFTPEEFLAAVQVAVPGALKET
jgi:DNA-binding NtrC family response regulator